MTASLRLSCDDVQMSEPVQDDEPSRSRSACRLVKELREINERLRWFLILILIPYIVLAVALLVALLSGGSIDLRLG